MRAVLVRHGETEQNAHGIFQGYSPGSSAAITGVLPDDQRQIAGPRSFPYLQMPTPFKIPDALASEGRE
jgi:hypothetical protein